MKLLVTGATGFIGRRVVQDATSRGHEVVALVRRNSVKRAPDGCVVVEGDLGDSVALGRALKEVDVVIHCAASLVGGTGEQQTVTIDGTKNLIAAMRPLACRRVVSVGTFANYDLASVPVGGVLDAECPLIEDFGRRHPYLAAKAEQEKLLASLRDEGFTVHLMRPGLVHGEGRRWFHHIGARLGPLWLVFSPNGQLPLVSVENCAAALVDVAERAESSAYALNVLDPELPTRRAYARRISAEASSRAIHIGIPWWMVSLPARLLSPFAKLLPLPDIARLDTLSERCKPIRYRKNSDTESE